MKYRTTCHLLPVRGSRPGKNVQLTEAEIRGLCLKSREIFLSQPILLELEAPLKICGKGVSYLAACEDMGCQQLYDDTRLCILGRVVGALVCKCLEHEPLSEELYRRLSLRPPPTNRSVFPPLPSSLPLSLPPSLSPSLPPSLPPYLPPSQVTFMASTMISCVCLSMEDSLLSRTICSWETMLTEENSRWRPFACCSPTRSSTLRTSSC